jgi:(1->4)-alpha-D-glucan 1-alpha-D-glucosylmutase
MIAALAPGAFDAEALIREARQLRDYQERKQYKDSVMAALAADEEKYMAILEALETFHADKEKMLSLLSAQHYTLAWWKDTNREINYRRFFTVNDLICLRMEDEEVFNEYHTYLHDLYRRQVIHGVRIDHIDGLRDPGGYITRLRQRFGDDCYIIAEKILEAKEDMPAQWPLQGTSGYEFLAFVNRLITSRKGARQLVSFYNTLVPGLPPYHELVMANKRLILEQYMAGEWDNLLHYLLALNLGAGFAAARLKQALGWLMVSLPVYRLYPHGVPLKGEALSMMNETFRKAYVHSAAQGVAYKAELEYLRALFTEPCQDATANANILSFVGRLMQFTGPLTAKGVEDTTFYVYNALLSHDEVGDAPGVLSISVAEFHNKMGDRQRHSPLSLNATATHDTKRGEDARLRLNVLCEFPQLWQQHVTRWLDINRGFRRRTSKGTIAPVVNDEYYIYQSIVGGFPEDLAVTDEFVQRIQQYYTKVLREAKVHSDWADPDEEYETTCRAFISNILRPGSDFLASFIPFAEKVSDRATRYALAQTLIKITAPGIPDIYQGCELWDLSFVDPDNRRPVDYAQRMEYLDILTQKEQEGPDALFSFMEDHRRQGIEKLFITWKALTFRKAHPHIFTEGAYLALQVTGKEVNAVAYARHYDVQWVLVIAPISAENGSQETGYEADVMLPPNAPSRWRNVLTGEELTTDGRLSLSECFARLPVALLCSLPTETSS